MQTIQSASSPESADLIRSFLQTRHSGVLATSNMSSNPHAAVVYFSTEDDLCLLFATKTETKKYKNIEQNDQVDFVTYDEKTQTTVELSGRVEKVQDLKTQQATRDAMYRSSETTSKSALPPIEKLFAGDYVTLRIIPLVIKMAIFLRPDSEGSDAYETITFA